MNNQVVIIDVGVSNLFNVRRGFEKAGAQVHITTDPKEIMDAPRVVLPGVGAFGAAVQVLERHDLFGTIRNYAKTGKPLLGICLGMQLLLTESEELGQWKGLDIIPGKVLRLDSPKDPLNTFKIPEIGWNALEPDKLPWRGTILDDLSEKSYVYFVHSFHCVPTDTSHILGVTSYGHNRFCSVIKKDNVSGCQFHPERSGTVGLKILKNFLKQE